MGILENKIREIEERNKKFIDIRMAAPQVDLTPNQVRERQESEERLRQLKQKDVNLPQDPPVLKQPSLFTHPRKITPKNKKRKPFFPPTDENRNRLPTDDTMSFQPPERMPTDDSMSFQSKDPLSTFNDVQLDNTTPSAAPKRSKPKPKQPEIPPYSYTGTPTDPMHQYFEDDTEVAPTSTSTPMHEEVDSNPIAAPVKPEAPKPAEPYSQYDDDYSLPQPVNVEDKEDYGDDYYNSPTKPNTKVHELFDYTVNFLDEQFEKLFKIETDIKTNLAKVSGVDLGQISSKFNEMLNDFKEIRQIAYNGSLGIVEKMASLIYSQVTLAPEVAAVRREVGNVFNILKEVSDKAQQTLKFTETLMPSEEVRTLRWELAYLGNVANTYMKEWSKMYSNQEFWLQKADPEAFNQEQQRNPNQDMYEPEPTIDMSKATPDPVAPVQPVQNIPAKPIKTKEQMMDWQIGDDIVLGNLQFEVQGFDRDTRTFDLLGYDNLRYQFQPGGFGLKRAQK